MRRRDFLSWAGGVVITAPFAAAAPPQKVWRIGILETTPAADNGPNLGAIRDGLRELGYVEGRNLIIEYRSADGNADRFRGLASELLRAKVNLIVTRGTPAVQAVKEASHTIPVVMAAMGAPLLVVDSLSRPGGNITGLTTFSDALIGKRIELLKELLPGFSRLGLLHNLGNPMSPPEWEKTKAAARALSLEALLFDVRRKRGLEDAFALAAARHVDALLVGGDGLTEANRPLIVSLAARYRIPASYPSRDFVAIGGLMSYAPNLPDLYRRAATFIDEILRGAKPADLPVEQPSRFVLAINLRTAKTLGISVSQSILLRADEVIE